MIMRCALAVPVICIKTSEQNFLLYQCGFIISEQFNEWGEEIIMWEGDMRRVEYSSLESYRMEQK